MIYERRGGLPGTRPVGLVRIHRPRGRVFRPSARRRAGAPAWRISTRTATGAWARVWRESFGPSLRAKVPNLDFWGARSVTVATIL